MTLSAHGVEELLESARRALAKRDGEEALRVLAPLAPLRTRDVALARLWLEALRLAPRTPTLHADVRTIVEAHAEPGSADGGDRATAVHDGIAVAIAACAALVAAAELRAPDEPPAGGGPAASAIGIAERALATLDVQSRRDPEVAGYLLVNLAAALRLARPEDDARVVAAYEEALALDPSRGAWWLALAVHHKWKLRFAEGLAAATEARARLGDERRVLWNVAICATGAGKGEAAVDAMCALGVPASLAKGGMPQAEGLPAVEVRLRARATGLAGDPAPESAESFEVVAVSPLSPCHGVVITPTLRDAIADYGDVVLWDAAPVAVRHAPGSDPGRPVPRFPLIAVLRRGDERRFRFLAREQREGEVAALAPGLPTGALLFVQHVRVDFVCPRCAAGESLVRHEHAPAEEHRVVRGKLVVPAETDLGAFRTELETLVRAYPGIALVVPELHEALGDTRAAGKAHTAWAGIERTAVRAVR